MAVSLLVRNTHPHRRVTTAFSSLWDKLGILASGLCLIDCLVLPVLSTALIGFQSTSSWARDLHWFLLPLIGVSASIAFYHSYRAHSSYLIVALGALGFALLVAGEIVEARFAISGINYVSLAGSAFLISAHARNLLMHAGKGKHSHTTIGRGPVGQHLARTADGSARMTNGSALTINGPALTTDGCSGHAHSAHVP
ncbi:MAG: MerC domain-containing protein [Turneriella sp.]